MEQSDSKEDNKGMQQKDLIRIQDDIMKLTLIKFKIIIGLPYLLTRFSK